MPGGQESAAGATPHFFLSYAHSHGSTSAHAFRRDLLVKRFHDDLREAVRGIVGASGPATSAVDFEIPVGSHWSKYISDSLAQCRSFVALYSSDYFSSENCGQEWQAFANRIKTEQILHGRQPQAVIPVLWQPVSEQLLPDCASELQYLNVELGYAYRRHGLVYLLRHMSEYHKEYEHAVLHFARRIVHVAENDSPARRERYPDYLTLGSAFLRNGEAPLPRPRVRIVIAAPSLPGLPKGADPSMYGPQPTLWKPYLPHFDGAIAGAAQRLAESMDFEVFVEALEVSNEFRNGSGPSAPTLLIIDPWAVEDPGLRQRLSLFDEGSQDRLWIRPVVVWNREHPDNKINAADLHSRLLATLTQCRLRYRPESPRVLDGLESIHDFIGELPGVIRTAERLYFTELARDRTPPVPARQRPGFGGPGPGFNGRATPDGAERIPPRSTGRPPVKAFLERQRQQEIPNSEGRP